MKCLYCNGKGDITKNNKKFRQTSRIKLFCPHCGGTGIEPLTNDEWRKTCSAKEFAEWISNLAYACMRCGMSNGEAYCHTGYCIQDKEDALMWLKQPHTNKE